jgi:hypothetical protein
MAFLNITLFSFQGPNVALLSGLPFGSATAAFINLTHFIARMQALFRCQFQVFGKTACKPPGETKRRLSAPFVAQVKG